MERNSFIFYRSFYEAIKDLSYAQQGRLYNAVAVFALFGEELADLTPVEKTVLTLIKPQIEANNKRYQNGIKGGRPTTKAKPSNNQSETEAKPNKNQDITTAQPNSDKGKPNVNDNDDDIRNNILSINARARARLEKLDIEHLRKMSKMVYGEDADKTVDEIFNILVELCQDSAFADMFLTKDDDFINRLVKKFYEDSESISDKHEYVKRTVELAKRVRFLDEDEV